MKQTYMKIAIVDDHKLILDGISDVVRKAYPKAIIETYTAASDILQAVQNDVFGYQLIVTDMQMPETSGFELCVTLLENNPEQHILVLSMINDVSLISQLRSIGVLGFIAKDEEPHLFIEAIKCCAEGGAFFNEVQLGGSGIVLFTKREYQILRLLAKGMGSKDIADNLNLSRHTVDTHRKNMLFKLDIKTTVELNYWASHRQII